MEHGYGTKLRTGVADLMYLTRTAEMARDPDEPFMDVVHHSDDEVRLSAHIRHLLLDYVHTHLTTDYIQFTENAVAEVCLFPL